MADLLYLTSRIRGGAMCSCWFAEAFGITVPVREEDGRQDAVFS